MKALTNILTRLLMLMLLMLVACTEETAEVDNLSRGEQYVTVRMNIPGMTATATRADDGVIESITALAFDDADKLLEVETITPVTNTNENGGFNGTFNLTVPNGTTTIHFLANLPDDATSQLPTEMGGSEVDVMTSLTTGDYNNLCYWGMTTTWDGNTNPLDVTLYRNLAKISIKPSITDTEFNQFEEGKLKIAGLINPNRVGKLVPYNNSFPQSIGELTFNTLPDNPDPLNVTPIGNDGAGYGNWLYVLEHENSNYEEYGLFVICKIGDYFYNVALTSDGVNPYPIIRNHEYIIYVSDVDDYQSEEYRSTNYSDMYDTNTSKILKTPINLEVKQKENASLTLTSATNTLYYGDSSEEAVTVTVSGIVEGVESLTLTAPGFSVLTDYATLQDGKYILDDGVTEIDFTLTLTDPAQAGTISVTGEGEYVNITNPSPISITLNEREEVDGETVLWQGAVKMHTPDYGANHAGKVLIPYSFFFDESNQPKVPVGSVVRIESTGSNWLNANETIDWTTIWILNDNGQDLVLTQDMLNTIRDNHNEVWGVDVAFVLQGGDGRVLNKVTLIPAKERIEANITNGATLYYDSDDTQVVTVNVTIPDGVETLNISAPDFIFDGENDGEYTYAVNSQTSATLSFTLKSGLSARTSTITFSDASGNATEDAVNVILVKTPEVTFSPDETSKIMSINETYTVTMDPNGGTLTSLSIAAEGFTVASSIGGLTGPTNNVYTYAGGYTQFTFTPTSAGSSTIRFYDGQGENINVPEKNIIVTVNAAITAEATPSTIYYDGNDKTVTVRVTIPKGVSGLSISAPNFKYGEETGGSYTYTRNDGATTETTVQLVFTLKDGVTEDSSITFSDANSNANVTGATVDINVEATPVVTNALTVTPITSTIINLADGGTKTVQLRLAIPSDLTYLSIFTNYAFEVSALNGYTQPRAQAPYYYYDYIQPGSVNTIDLEITMDADLIFETEGDYPITFYTVQNSSEGLTTTISVVNDDLDDGVIWEGSKTAIAAGYRLKYTSFSEYRDSDKQLKIDVTPTGDGWKQFYIKYEGDNNNNLKAVTADNIDSTLSIDIPSEDRDLIISGEGGITITKIYVE